MSAVLTYEAVLEDNGKTVEKVLKKQFNISASLMTNLKLNGHLRINGKVCRSVDEVFCGDIITADVSENCIASDIIPTELPLDILFEDDSKSDLILVYRKK